MPTKGRFPRFLVLFVLAVSFFGIVSFQILKERRIASAALSEKNFELQAAENNLKEQVRVASKRKEERDYAQTKLLELERVSESALSKLRSKEKELETIKRQHQDTVHEMDVLKRMVDQKEGEIVDVRGKLQDVSFERAKESADQYISVRERQDAERRQAEEHKPADEVGLIDRMKVHLEEQTAKEVEAISATEREMHERSQPKDGLSMVLAEGTNKEADKKNDASKNLEGVVDEETDEQDTADEKEIQEVDLNEVTKLEVDLQTGDHEEAGSQTADHDTE